MSEDDLDFEVIPDPEADICYVLSHRGLADGWVILGLKDIKAIP